MTSVQSGQSMPTGGIRASDLSPDASADFSEVERMSDALSADYKAIVDQLMTLESRPKDRLQTRIDDATTA